MRLRIIGLRTLGALCAAALAPGCSTLCQFFCSSSPPAALPDAFGIVSGDPGGDLISQTVTVIADSHAHYLWGDPNILQTLVADRVSPSAIRTPQADLWGPYFQQWVLGFALKKRTLIHLGDAADIACAAEYESFVAMMAARSDATKFSWFQAPGNHDAYYFGNFHDDHLGQWTAACKGSVPLTKDKLVARYLTAVTGQDHLEPGLAKLKTLPLSTAQQRYDDLGAGGILTAIAWNVSVTAPWQSFVVQSLDLTMPHSPRQVLAILLDTAAYDEAPVLLPAGGGINAGLTGDITDLEATAVRAWAEKAHKAGAVVVVMGHHPLTSLTARGQALLTELHARDGAVLYVSAHDHSGKWKTNGAGGNGWPELNIGSLLDEPVEGRSLIFSVLKDGSIGVKSELTRLDALLERPSPAVPKCLPEWEAKPKDGDYYTSYRELVLGENDIPGAIYNVLLATWHRYLTFVPSSAGAGPWPAGWATDADALSAIDEARAIPNNAAKITILQKLIRDSGQRASDARVRDDFRICQGYWGSKYERTGARVPDVDDWSITIPKE